jgi:hypothetical protein
MRYFPQGLPAGDHDNEGARRSIAMLSVGAPALEREDALLVLDELIRLRNRPSVDS